MTDALIKRGNLNKETCLEGRACEQTQGEGSHLHERRLASEETNPAEHLDFGLQPPEL